MFSPVPSTILTPIHPKAWVCKSAGAIQTRCFASIAYSAPVVYGILAKETAIFSVFAEMVLF